MLEFSYNKTMDWLKSQGEERERAQVTLAQQRKKDVVYEVREEAERLHKTKLEGQRREVEKAQAQEKVRLDKLDSIKDETLVSSIDQLNQRVTEIHCLSIPMDLKDAEVKKLVQRQVQLHTMVFQQKGIKTPLSVKSSQEKFLSCSKTLKILSGKDQYGSEENRTFNRLTNSCFLFLRSHHL